MQQLAGARTISTAKGFHILEPPHLGRNKVVTMGPKTTSSYHAATMFVDTIKHLVIGSSFEIVTFDNFDQVYQCLTENDAEYAIIPNAYEDVTKYYWNRSLKLNGYFRCHTPGYVIAAQEASVSLGCPRVASCPAVYQLIDDAVQAGTFQDYQLVSANSTDHAARLVLEGSADLAVTNTNSVKHYGLTDVKSFYGVEMLWSIFTKKQP